MQWLHEGALGSLSAARISARAQMNICATLVNCSKTLVGGRGKRREMGLPFSPALIQWKADDWELLKDL